MKDLPNPTRGLERDTHARAADEPAPTPFAGAGREYVRDTDVTLGGVGTCGGDRRTNAPKSAPRTPLARRECRRRVEALMLDGRSLSAIHALVGAEFSVSARTIRDDMKLVEKRWGREDRAALEKPRQALVRRMQRVAVKAEASGDYSAATGANLALARVLGLVGAGSVNVDARSVSVGGAPMTLVDLIRKAEHDDRGRPRPEPQDDPRLTDPAVRAAQTAYVNALARLPDARPYPYRSDGTTPPPLDVGPGEAPVSREKPREDEEDDDGGPNPFRAGG